MTCNDCFITTDGKIGLCPRHYRDLISDSNISNLSEDNDENIEIEYIYGIPIVKKKD